MTSITSTGSATDIRALVDALPDALLVQSDNIIVFVNPALTKMMGSQGTGELIGQNIARFIHPKFLPRVQQQIAVDYATGEVSAPLEILAVRIDGSTVPVEGIGRSVMWDGRPAMEIVLRDITDRKRSEELLSDLERQLELAERAARMGLWEWDFAQGVVKWSDEVYRQFGYTKENFTGNVSDFFARVHPDDRTFVESSVNSVIDGAATYDIRFRILGPEGELRWIDSHGVVKPDTTVMIGVAYDITELKNAQAR